MELRQLRYFIAVVDAGSFTAAARQSFVTQPTLSTAISNLEAELGRQLFDRTPRGAVLTEAGRDALVQARAAIGAAEALRSPTPNAATQRTLRAGVAPTLPPKRAIEALAAIHERFAGRAVRVEAAPLTTLRRRLAAGRLDLLVTVLNDTVGRDVRQLETTTDEMCLLFARDRQPSASVAPEILHDAPLVVRTHCEFLSAASRVLDERHVRPIITARVDSDALAVELVTAGHGACLMPDSFATDDTVAVTVDGLDLHRRIGLEWTAAELDELGDVP